MDRCNYCPRYRVDAECRTCNFFSIVAPEGATNGDVIESIYCQYGLVIRFRPRGEVVVDMTKLQNNGMIPNMAFSVDWWNAPYKAESEE